jgi:hypothetical protein
MDASPEPRLVSSLQHLRVSSVSCGYYHSAAVCCDLSSSVAGSAYSDSTHDHDSRLGPQATRTSSSKQQYLYVWGACFEAADSKGGVMLSSNDGCLGLKGLKPHEGILRPHAVELPNVQAVACGMNFTVVMDRDGSVFQMGSMLRAGPLPGVEWEGSPVAVRVRGVLEGACALAICAGRAHAVVSVIKEGSVHPQQRSNLAEVVTWGCNRQGQLGRGPAPNDVTSQDRIQNCADYMSSVPKATLLVWATPAPVNGRRSAAVRSIGTGAHTTFMISSVPSGSQPLAPTPDSTISQNNSAVHGARRLARASSGGLRALATPLASGIGSAREWINGHAPPRHPPSPDTINTMARLAPTNLAAGLTALSESLTPQQMGAAWENSGSSMASRRLLGNARSSLKPTAFTADSKDLSGSMDGALLSAPPCCGHGRVQVAQLVGHAQTVTALQYWWSAVTPLLLVSSYLGWDANGMCSLSGCPLVLQWASIKASTHFCHGCGWSRSVDSPLQQASRRQLVDRQCVPSNRVTEM